MMATSPVYKLAVTVTIALGLAGTFSQKAQGGPPVPPKQPARLHFAPVGPPLGTLTMTYRRPSRLIPEDRHPRTGMLDIWNVPAGAEVTIKNMKGYRGKDCAWHFESEHPLLPGIPHIYRVHVRICHVGAGHKKVSFDDVRTIRLIPGRIVDLGY